MKGLFASLLLLIFAPMAARADSIEVCGFYKTKAAELGCEKENYLIRFGYHYCRKYLLANEHFSAEGQKILADIRACLIHSLEVQTDLTCGDVKKLAEESHVSCYAQNGFCQLSAGDKLLVAEIAWKEFFDPDFRKVAHEVRAACEQ
jgi:hypothetical protein